MSKLIMKVIETIIVKSTAETSESTTEETTNFPFSFTDEGAEDIVSAFN